MMGLTNRMKETLAAIVGHVSMHGTMPSHSAIGERIGSVKGGAQRIVTNLVERGALTRSGGGKASMLAFGSAGVFVCIAPHVAAKLATHALRSGDLIQSIVEDAITLHLDEAGESPRTLDMVEALGLDA